MSNAEKGVGEFEVALLGPDGQPVRRSVARNRLMADWAVVACSMFGDGNANYRLRGFYVEFANLDDPDDTVSVPVDDAIDATEGQSYYEGLSSSPNHDFLRVPISVSPEKFLESDATSWGVPFNGLRFQASTDGVVGVHGKPFDLGHNSKIYGLALVAAPDWEDRTLDRVYAKVYYEAAQQLLALAVGQVSLRYTRTFRI
jgi:hypothetical protein